MKKLLVSTGVLLALLLLLMPRPRLLLALSTETEAPADTTKFPIMGARWYQLNNVSTGLDGLFDGNTSQEVNTGYGKLLKNYDAYYPLRTGEQMTIERIRMYDGNGTNVDEPLTISIITDTWERIPIARFIGDKYDAWVGRTRPNPTYLPSPHRSRVPVFWSSTRRGPTPPNSNSTEATNRVSPPHPLRPGIHPWRNNWVSMSSSGTSKAPKHLGRSTKPAFHP